MADKHQSEWLNHLPFVLLGRKVALQPDIQASSSELTFGQNLRIPGQILNDPGEAPTKEELEELLKSVRENTTITPSQTSSHGTEKDLPEIPSDITHVYTRQHKAVGLQTPFEGPFRIESRPSKSTVKIEVGIFKSGEKRYEIRHLNDLKLAHPDSLAAPVQRSKLGRPSKPTDADAVVEGHTDENTSSSAGLANRLNPNPTSSTSPSISKQIGTETDASHATSTHVGPVPASPPKGGKIQTRLPTRTTRNPNPVYIDEIRLTGPPQFKPFMSRRPWSASASELDDLNRAISSFR